jgi:hypothetical protein
MKKIVFILAILALFAGGCDKTDKAPETTVSDALTRVLIVSDSATFQAAIADTESEGGKTFFKAKQELSALFVNDSVERRVRAQLRSYDPKGFEHLKTIENEKGTFVVVFLRSDSKTAGEPVDKRPGWRKALFMVQRVEDAVKIADLDRVVEKYGETPLFMDGGK